MTFPRISELAEKLEATKPLLRLKEAPLIANTREAMMRSFVVLWFWPFDWLMRWLEDAVYLKAYNAEVGKYLAYVVVSTPLAYVLSLWLAHYLSKITQASQNFYGFVATANWFSLWIMIISAPIKLVQVWPFGGNDSFSRGVQIALDNGWFLYASFMAGIVAWRSLKIELLTGIGIGIMVGIPGTLLYDFVAIKTFGLARPFFN
jgi:hypothetical protein